MSSQWRDIFDQRGAHRGGEPHPALAPDDLEEADLQPERGEYRPWVLQRGRGRPTMLLHLRRYEPRSGMWTGWALSYPSLIAAEYIGERMLSLDFGLRQFIIEGDGLSSLLAQLQLGAVSIVQEFNATVWPNRPTGPLITSLRRVGGPADS